MSRIFKHILFCAAIITLFATIYACNNDACEGNGSSLPLAGFYSSQTKKAITVDSVSVYGIGMVGDTTIINIGRNIRQTYLPLNTGKSCSEFVIRYDQKALAEYNLTDTLKIEYSAIPYFHSSECGAMYLFDVTSHEVTNNLIDSVQFLTTRIDNTDAENIKIFFRTEKEADK